MFVWEVPNIVVDHQQDDKLEAMWFSFSFLHGVPETLAEIPK